MKISDYSWVVLLVVFLSGCNSTHDPDSNVINKNSWNRTEVLDKVFWIFVRGEKMSVKRSGSSYSSNPENADEFIVLDKIFAEAIEKTCPDGIKEIIVKRQVLKPIGNSVTTGTVLDLVGKALPHSTMFDPYIESAIQCVGSKVSAREINDNFRLENSFVEDLLLEMDINFDKVLHDNPP